MPDLTGEIFQRGIGLRVERRLGELMAAMPRPLKAMPLLDHLVGGGQQRFRDGEAEGLGGLKVDDQFELCQPLDGQVGWLSVRQWRPSLARTT
jgi:hypothetical protein